MKEQDLVGVILAGGLNRRMEGSPKLLLTYEGKAFYERAVEAMVGATNGIAGDDIYLSVNKEGRFEELGLKLIVDNFQQIGPMGGILSSMMQIHAKAFLVVASDMPLVTSCTVDDLLAAYADTGKTVVSVVDGKTQPLLAVYTREIIPFFQKAVDREDYRLREVISQLSQIGRVKEVTVEKKTAININTVFDAEQLT